MTREIKFRGKAKENNIWLYGNIQIPSKENVGYFMWGGKYNLQYEVFPETIGQFTGLHDKNGNEIYEGDIIKNTNNKTGYITFLQQEMGYVIVWSNSDTRLGHRSRGSGYDFDMTLEIIGNIHDNPELLNE